MGFVDLSVITLFVFMRDHHDQEAAICFYQSMLVTTGGNRVDLSTSVIRADQFRLFRGEDGPQGPNHPVFES